jgi:hypothetical protein
MIDLPRYQIQKNHRPGGGLFIGLRWHYATRIGALKPFKLIGNKFVRVPDHYVWSLDIGLLTHINNMLVALAVISGAASLFLILASAMLASDEEEIPKWVKGSIKCSLSVFLAVLLVGSIVPSTKTLATMIILPKIANSQVFQKDVPALYNLAIDRLKEILEDKPKTETEKKETK